MVVQHKIPTVSSVCSPSHPNCDMLCYISLMKDSHGSGDGGIDGDALVSAAPSNVVRTPFHAHMCVYDHVVIKNPRHSTSEVIARSFSQSLEHSAFCYMLCRVLFKMRISDLQLSQLPVPLLRRNPRRRSNMECLHARLLLSRRGPSMPMLPSRAKDKAQHL